MVDVDAAPTLAGVHHLKLPVADLERSIEWYRSRLGYRSAIEFVEDGVLMGVSMRHLAGGPELALRLDPERAATVAGFDFFAIGVPDEAAMRVLAGRLDALGETHAGLLLASIGWILPGVHDPDGHEVRFYTLSTHTEVPDGSPLRIENAHAEPDPRASELAAGADT